MFVLFHTSDRGRRQLPVVQSNAQRAKHTNSKVWPSVRFKGKAVRFIAGIQLNSHNISISFEITFAVGADNVMIGVLDGFDVRVFCLKIRHPLAIMVETRVQNTLLFQSPRPSETRRTVRG
jgi:hypothetical protein